MIILLALLAWLWGVVNAGVDQFNTLAGVTLTRGRVTNQSLATGAVLNMDVPCGGSDFVTVEGDMTAGAAGDLTVSVFPYEADGVTLQPQTLPPVAGVGYAGTLSGGHSYLVQQYDVKGIDKVQVQFKNNNVGTQTLTRGSWRTASW